MSDSLDTSEADAKPWVKPVQQVVGDEDAPAVTAAAKPEPCQNTTMGEHACKNRHQCWESCGELGHSEKHARPATKETQDAVNAALGLAAPARVVPLTEEQINDIKTHIAGLAFVAEITDTGRLVDHVISAIDAARSKEQGK